MKLTILASSLLFAILASPSPVSEAKKCVCNIACTVGKTCVPFPTDKGCKNICIVPEFCGGFAGIPCEAKDDICVDDPRDDCDPKHGGADCGGLCVPKGLLGY